LPFKELFLYSSKKRGGVDRERGKEDAEKRGGRELETGDI
jgi:hypothetical protein